MPALAVIVEGIITIITDLGLGRMIAGAVVSGLVGVLFGKIRKKVV